VYREPHLNKKSKECGDIWYEWYDVKYVLKDKEKAKELRKQWCKCASELGEMVHQEFLTNPRYKDVKLFPGKEKPPR
jgi:hypothetical protein